MKTLVQSVKPLSALLPPHLRLTHNLTQNRKKAVETMERRGRERTELRMKDLQKLREMSKPHFGAQPHNPEVAGSSPVSATIKVKQFGYSELNA